MIKRIEKWGEERDLYEQSTFLDQYDKLVEELGELFKASNGTMDLPLYKDAIGDMFVCLVHCARFEGVWMTFSGYTSPYFSRPTMQRLLLTEVAEIQHSLADDGLYGAVENSLSALAFMAGTTLEKCVEEVLDVIEKRKGRFINGKYVKAEDMQAEADKHPDPLTPWQEQAREIVQEAVDSYGIEAENAFGECPPPLGTAEAVIADRGQDYGRYTEVARLDQEFKSVLASGRNWDILADTQKTSLEMITHKIARILNGNPDKLDTWLDIGGYSELIHQLLQGKEP